MELLSFGIWWEGLSTLTKIYWMLVIPASAIFVIQLALSFLRKEPIHSNSLETSIANIDTPITFEIINFKNFMGFFTGFGWSGLACIDSGLTTIPTLTISFICGFIVMASMAITIYFMSKLMKTVDENM